MHAVKTSFFVPEWSDIGDRNRSVLPSANTSPLGQLPRELCASFADSGGETRHLPVSAAWRATTLRTGPLYRRNFR